MNTFEINPHIMVYGKFINKQRGDVLLEYDHQITSLTKGFPEKFKKICIPDNLLINAEIIKKTKNKIDSGFLITNIKNHVVLAKISYLYEEGHSGRRYTQATIWLFKETDWNIAYLSGCIKEITTEADNLNESEEERFSRDRKKIINKGIKVDLNAFPRFIQTLEDGFENKKNITIIQKEYSKDVILSVLIQLLQKLDQEVGCYSVFLELVILIRDTDYQIIINNKTIDITKNLMASLKEDLLGQKKDLEPCVKLKKSDSYKYDDYKDALSNGYKRFLDGIILEKIKLLVNQKATQVPLIQQLSSKKEKMIIFLLESIGNITSYQTYLKENKKYKKNNKALIALSLLRYTAGGDSSWDKAWFKIYNKYHQWHFSIKYLFILRHKAIDPNTSDKKIILDNETRTLDFSTTLLNLEHLLILRALPYNIESIGIKTINNENLRHAFFFTKENPYLFLDKVLTLLIKDGLWNDFNKIEELFNIEDQPKWFWFTLSKYAFIWNQGQFATRLYLFVLIGDYITKDSINIELKQQESFIEAVKCCSNLLDKIKDDNSTESEYKESLYEEWGSLSLDSHLGKKNTLEACLNNGLFQTSPISPLEKYFKNLLEDDANY